MTNNADDSSLHFRRWRNAGAVVLALIVSLVVVCNARASVLSPTWGAGVWGCFPWTASTAPPGPVNYRYDASGRVAAAVYGGGSTLGYSMDAVGNVTQVSSFSITTTMLPPAILTQSYINTIGVSGGASPVTFSLTAGALATGLTLNSGTGNISGAPTAAGSSTITVTATDATGHTSSQIYSALLISPLTISTTSLPAPVITMQYSQTLSSSGGAPPVTWSLCIGTVPTGLTLNSMTGAVSGVATIPGPYTFTIEAKDSIGAGVVQAYSGTTLAGPTITTTSLPVPVLTLAYSQTIVTSGGTSPFTFSVPAGALPTGLTLNAATGVISGTPTVSGAYGFTISAADANSLTVSQPYSGAIAALPTITTASLPPPVIGTYYYQTISTSGGTAPITFSVSAGALPMGMSLNFSTGLIYAAPTSGSTYGFTIEITDANGLMASQPYTGSFGTPAVHVVFLAGSGTFVCPVGLLTSVEVIGGGGGGGSSVFGGATNVSFGGGGGGYSKSTNVTCSGTMTYSAGAGGAGRSGGASGGGGGDTWFGGSSLATATLGAQGGGGATAAVAGSGGAASAGVGSVKYGGGAGGGQYGGAGGGGGAGGPHGGGGNSYAVGTGASIGWGGGGGGGGSSSVGDGYGGNNYLGAGGGSCCSAYSPGVNGGGGGGGTFSPNYPGAYGGAGTEWDASHGSGGGGGGSGWNTSGGAGGLYGAGGGGGNNYYGSGSDTGGPGAPGLIVITATF